MQLKIFEVMKKGAKNYSSLSRAEKAQVLNALNGSHEMNHVSEQVACARWVAKYGQTLD